MIELRPNFITIFSSILPRKEGGLQPPDLPLVGLVTLVVWEMTGCLSSYYLENCKGNGLFHGTKKWWRDGVLSELKVINIDDCQDINAVDLSSVVLEFGKWNIPGDRMVVLLTLSHRGLF